MKTILITGSTRGIGYGLADNFLRMGQQVIISGRTQKSVDQALKSLAEDHSKENIAGFPCDMREFSQVEDLWQLGVKKFGGIDIWINNAGIALAQTPFWELEEDLIQDLVNTNITGALYGARVALAGFLAQGRGAFYNMEGLGSDGRQVEGLTLYGTSKRALAYLTDSLVSEVKGTDLIVGAIQPGMVMTDLILKRYEGKEPGEWESARRIFNILADRVETVTPFIAEKVLENKKNGARIKWLTSRKVLWRFLTASLIKRDVFQDLEI
ncbi:MAG: SDR family oxidoreductase [Anaerolineales bacterium]|nr:SDR family oxidoreductase [Anaerolineales bacterium]